MTKDERVFYNLNFLFLFYLRNMVRPNFEQNSLKKSVHRVQSQLKVLKITILVIYIYGMAVVTYCVTKMITTCSQIIGQLLDTISDCGIK